MLGTFLNSRFRLHLVVASLAIPPATTACDSSDDETPEAPPPAPTLKITRITSDLGDQWSQDGDVITLGCSASLVAVLSTKNWKFNAPSGCEANTQCGSARFELRNSDGDLILEQHAAGKSATLALSDKTPPTGELQLLVQLQQREGIFKVDAEAVAATADLVLKHDADADCNGSGGEGGAGGAGGAGGDGGSSPFD